MQYIIAYNTNELYHHGIKGQKWGERRYQNPDGSYTKEGLEHRNSKLSLYKTSASEKVERHYKKIFDKYDSKIQEYSNKYAKTKNEKYNQKLKQTVYAKNIYSGMKRVEDLKIQNLTYDQMMSEKRVIINNALKNISRAAITISASAIASSKLTEPISGAIQLGKQMNTERGKYATVARNSSRAVYNLLTQDPPRGFRTIHMQDVLKQRGQINNFMSKLMYNQLYTNVVNNNGNVGQTLQKAFEQSGNNYNGMYKALYTNSVDNYLKSRRNVIIGSLVGAAAIKIGSDIVSGKYTTSSDALTNYRISDKEMKDIVKNAKTEN